MTPRAQYANQALHIIRKAQVQGDDAVNKEPHRDTPGSVHDSYSTKSSPPAAADIGPTGRVGDSDALERTTRHITRAEPNLDSLSTDGEWTSALEKIETEAVATSNGKKAQTLTDAENGLVAARAPISQRSTPSLPAPSPS